MQLADPQMQQVSMIVAACTFHVLRCYFLHWLKVKSTVCTHFAYRYVLPVLQSASASGTLRLAADVNTNTCTLVCFCHEDSQSQTHRSVFTVLVCSGMASCYTSTQLLLQVEL